MSPVGREHKIRKQKRYQLHTVTTRAISTSLLGLEILISGPRLGLPIVFAVPNYEFIQPQSLHYAIGQLNVASILFVIP